MKRRVPLGIALALIIFAAAVSSGVTVYTLNKQYNRVVAGFSQRTAQYDFLADIDTVVRNNYYGEIDSDTLSSAVANGYSEGIPEGDCVYLSPDDYKSYIALCDGEHTGIGIGCYYDEIAEALTISSVEKNSPADKAELVSGLYITAVDSKPVTRENSAALIDTIILSNNKAIKLTVSTGGQDETTVKVKSGYKAPAVTYSVSGKTGFVRISSFYSDAPEEFAKALAYFENKSVGSIIIDLRNNSGYNYESAAAVTDMLVPVASLGNKAIAVETDRNGDAVRIYSSDSSAVSVPVAVLVNDRTSGAAELLACDLRQFGKGSIFGEKTAGDAGVKNLFELSQGSAVLLKTGMITPYNCDTYDGKGIEPDVTVLQTAAEKNTLADIAGTKKDAVYTSAAEALK